MTEASERAPLKSLSPLEGKACRAAAFPSPPFRGASRRACAPLARAARFGERGRRRFEASPPSEGERFGERGAAPQAPCFYPEAPTPTSASGSKPCHPLPLKAEGPQGGLHPVEGPGDARDQDALGHLTHRVSCASRRSRISAALQSGLRASFRRVRALKPLPLPRGEPLRLRATGARGEVWREGWRRCFEASPPSEGERFGERGRHRRRRAFIRKHPHQRLPSAANPATLSPTPLPSRA